MSSTTDAGVTAPPDWFIAALGTPVEQRTVTVDGVPIAYRGWGKPGPDGIVLVHGGGAHSRWWDHIGPLLAGERRVAAIDLSGHGDSGRRQSYGPDDWAREVLAVAEDAGISAPPTVVGHSMGGFVTLRLASMFGSRLQGAVTIDTPVRDITPEEEAAREHRAFRSLHVYPSREAILARFRPVPDQPVLGYVKEHVAVTSIRQAEGGWTWKWDPRVFRRDPFPPALLTRRLPGRALPGRARPGVRADGRHHVRPAGPRGASHRNPRSRAPHHARPAHRAHRCAPHPAFRLGSLTAGRAGRKRRGFAGTASGRHWVARIPARPMTTALGRRARCRLIRQCRRCGRPTAVPWWAARLGQV